MVIMPIEDEIDSSLPLQSSDDLASRQAGEEGLTFAARIEEDASLL